jgi:hypothetical protein
MYILSASIRLYKPIILLFSNYFDIGKYGFRMAANSKQTSILVGRENYQMLRVSLNIQIGNNICLDLEKYAQ